MNKLSSYLILWFSILILSACNEKETFIPEYKISSDNTNLNFDFQGGKKTIEIEADIDWQVAGHGWLKINPETGKAGKTKVEIQADPNPLKEEREMILRFKARSAKCDIRVVQTEYTIDIDRDSLLLSPAGEEHKVQLKANGKWSLKKKPEWCEISPVSGEKEETEVKISVPENNTKEDRTGFIIFANGLSEDFIVVKQEKYRLDLSPEEVNADLKGGVYKIILTANADWTASTEASSDFYNLDKNNGKSGRHELQLTLSANKSETRNYTIDFKCGDFTMPLRVTQTGPDFIFEEVEIAGLTWCDRNLYAKTTDYANDWTNSLGLFYQWGRNIGYEAGKTEVVEGPLKMEEIALNKDDEGEKRFITVASEPYIWSKEKDDELWKKASPCPKGFRVPTYEDWLTIMPPSYDIGKIVYSDNVKAVTEGKKNSKTHYYRKGTYSTTDFLHWGIKRQGSSEAYILRWEYKNYSKVYTDNYVLEISYWKVDKSASFFTDASESNAKTKEELEAMFKNLREPLSVLKLPAATSLTAGSGNNDVYGYGKYAHYWCSDIDTNSTEGNLAYCIVFQTGAYMDSNYRAMGAVIRCVK